MDEKADLQSDRVIQAKQGDNLAVTSSCAGVRCVRVGDVVTMCNIARQLRFQYKGILRIGKFGTGIRCP